jgi:hypothetical protein
MRPRRARHAVATAALLLLCCALGACGGSSSGNGVARKSAAQIVAAARTAAAGAKSVHVTGSIVSGGSPITLDMHLVSPRGGRGRLSDNGLGFELIQIGDTVYIKGSAALYTHVGGPAAAQLLQGRWLKAPTTNPAFSSISSLTDLAKLIGTSLPDPSALSKGAETTVGRQKVITVSDKGKGESLYVATTGRPYPVEIAKAGAGGGRVRFDRWNEPLTLRAPANAIDITQLQGAAK